MSTSITHMEKSGDYIQVSILYEFILFERILSEAIYICLVLFSNFNIMLSQWWWMFWHHCIKKVVVSKKYTLKYDKYMEEKLIACIKQSTILRRMFACLFFMHLVSLIASFIKPSMVLL